MGGQLFSLLDAMQRWAGEAGGCVAGWRASRTQVTPYCSFQPHLKAYPPTHCALESDAIACGEKRASPCRAVCGDRTFLQPGKICSQGAYGPGAWGHMGPGGTLRPGGI